MTRGEWLLLGVSTTLSLALLELLLGLFFPLFASPYQPDDVVLVKHVPGANKAYVRMPVNGGQRIVSHYNTQGFRGPELRPPDHLKRLIVYGDSNVQAEFSELAATFPKQLEARLAAGQSPGVEVLNAGVVGDGPDQISLRLPGDLQQYKPTTVVVVIFADNDFGDLIRNRIYRLSPTGDLQLGHYSLTPELRNRMLRTAYPRGLRKLQLAKRAMQLVALMRERWSGAAASSEQEFFAHYVDNSLALDRTAFRDYMTTGATGASGSDGGYAYAADPFYDYYDADIALQPDSPAARYKIALMEKVLIQLRDTAAQAHTELILTILPSAIDACEHYDFTVDAQRYPQYDRTRLSGLVEDMAVRNGIPYLNLWQAFHRQDSTCYYFHGGDDHWNDEGQARAAQLLADFMKRRP